MNKTLSNKNSWLRQLFLYVRFGILVSVVAVLAACDSKGKVVITGPIMGTQYNITLACESDKSKKQWRDLVSPAMESVNQTMSTYIADSELSKFNASQSDEFQDISPSMLNVLSAAQRVSQETNGAFDVTVMPAVNAWGFGPKQKSQLSELKALSENELSDLRKQVGYKKLEISKSFIQWRKTNPAVEVDFSAIAKGYAVDQVSNTLLDNGCVNHLVEIGGEIRASGTNFEGNPWRLAVEKASMKGGIQAIVYLTDMSVASSGDYRNFYMIDGKRYSHTIDPRTLKPVEHGLASVTVLDPITARADALATAFMVMGNDALEYAEENNIPAYFIFRSGLLSEEGKEQYQVMYSTSFEKYITVQ